MSGIHPFTTTYGYGLHKGSIYTCVEEIHWIINVTITSRPQALDDAHAVATSISSSLSHGYPDMMTAILLTWINAFSNFDDSPPLDGLLRVYTE
ncbi:hypothetical protein FRB95_014779 [Tulasnella sp. JGI-2019a]|nr:hypothetical protein FRB95_014779 [Tulasnella sp. JGI-2019a]